MENFKAIEIISEANKKDNLVLVVGAGCSIDSRFPNWKSLMEDLRNEVNIKVNTFENDYPKVAELIFNNVGEDKYIGALKKIFYKFDHNNFNKTHELIKQIEPHSIVTTNFDELLENLFSESEIKYDVIKKNSDIAEATQNKYIIKMHGDLSDQSEHFVFKEEDYLNYEENFKFIVSLLRIILVNKTVLFIGYSLSDTTFIKILNEINKIKGDNKSKMFFYTNENFDAPTVVHYEKKGIHIVSNVEKIENPDETKSEDLQNFLRSILYQFKTIPMDDMTMKDLKPFEKISYLDIESFTNIVNSYEHSYVYPYGTFQLINNKINVNVENKELIDFIENKTRINLFLKKKFNNKPSVQSKILQKGYYLFDNSQYLLAYKEFVKVANQCYKRKDFLNFLIASLNISTCIQSLQYYGNYKFEDFNYDYIKVMENLIKYGSDEDKKIAQFFKDNIYQVKFLTRKLAKFGELFSELKNSSKEFRDGRTIWDTKILEINKMYEDIFLFAQNNCICIKNFEEQYSISNTWFMANLLAYENHKHYEKIKDEITLRDMSERLEKFSDFQILNSVKYLDFEKINIVSSEFSIRKINLDEKIIEKLVSKFLLLINFINDEDKYININEINSYLMLFEYINNLSEKNIIDVLEGIRRTTIINNVSFKCYKVIEIIISMKNKIQGDNLIKVQNLIFELWCNLLDNWPTKGYRRNYVEFLQYFNEFLETFGNQFICIELVEKKMNFLIESYYDEAINFDDFAIFSDCFYDILTEDTKSKIKNIFNINNIINNMHIDFAINSGHVIDLSLYSKEFETKILKDLDVNIQRKRNNEEYDLKYVLFCIYKLSFNNIIDLNNIKQKINYLDIKRESDIYDWFIMNDRSDELIESIMETRPYEEIIDSWCKDQKDIDIVNNWLISNMKKININFKNN